MNPRVTHTVVVMELSARAYDEIKGHMERCGYQHCFDGDLIDLSQIGVVRATPEAQSKGKELTHPLYSLLEMREMERRKDAAYEERNRVVALLARLVVACGGKAGTGRTAIEGWSPDWHGCVYIDLPTGQASWHFHDSHAWLFNTLPKYEGWWDGHDTHEKYVRVDRAFNPPVRAYDEVVLEALIEAFGIEAGKTALYVNSLPLGVNHRSEPEYLARKNAYNQSMSTLIDYYRRK